MAEDARFAPRNTIDFGAASDFSFDSVHAADLDGDGDPDLLSASYCQADLPCVMWHENLGAGEFGPRLLVSEQAVGAFAVVAGDVDGDGDPDALSASYADDTIAWHENRRGGPLPLFDPAEEARHIITSSADGAWAVQVADLDRDGDLDVLSASYRDGIVAWHENLAGNGTAWAAHEIASEGAWALIVADVDRDGDADVVVAENNDLTWYENRSGESDAGGPLPLFDAFLSSHRVAPDAFTIGLAAADVDADGDLDLLAAADDAVLWYENPSESRSPWTLRLIDAQTHGAVSIAVEDMDRDGDPDALVASEFDCVVSWYENDGSPTDDASGTPHWTGHVLDADVRGAESVIATDVDADGDADVVYAALGPDSTDASTVSWQENRSIHRSALYTDTRVISTAASGASGVFAGDVDGDGDLDVLSASQIDDTLRWYESRSGQSDGGGEPLPLFDSDPAAPRSISTGVLDVFGLHAADVDGDGDLDALSASFADDRISWHENPGHDSVGSAGATWPLHTIASDADGALAVVVADVDHDGDLDVLSASREDDTVSWHENDGAQPPGWTRYPISTSADGAWSVVAADVDGDGDLDAAAAAEFGDRIAWYENPGAAIPAVQQAPWVEHLVGSPDGPRSVFAADMDGDGDVDLLSASRMDDSIAWYENDPDDTGTKGSFDGSGQVISDHALGARAVFALDLDADGDLDVASASQLDNRIVWYENDGTPGGLGDWSALEISDDARGAQAIFAGDLDGDGDPDLLSASFFDEKVAWYPNLGGQFALATTSLAPDLDLDGQADEDPVNLVDDDGDGFVDEDPPGVLPATVAGAVLRIAVHHRGRPGDPDLRLAEVELSVELVDPATPGETDPEPGAKVEAIRIHRDLPGSRMGIFDRDDPLLSEIGASAFTGRRATLVMPTVGARASDALVSAGESGTFFAVVSLTEQAVGLDFSLSHLAAGGNTKAAQGDAPLLLEDSADLASTVLRVTPAPPDNDGDGILDDRDRDDDNDGLCDTPADAVPDADDPDTVCSGGEDANANGVVDPGETDPFAADSDGDAIDDGSELAGGSDPTDGFSYPSYPFAPPPFDTLVSEERPRDLVSADLDGDGDDDLLAAEGAVVRWYENLRGATGSWLPHVIDAAAGGAAAVAARDVDGDGDLDAVVALEDEGRVAWYENDALAAPGAPWRRRPLANDLPGANAVVVADVDRDGDPDVFVSSSDPKVSPAWYENLRGESLAGAGGVGQEAPRKVEVEYTSIFVKGCRDGNGSVPEIGGHWRIYRVGDPAEDVFYRPATSVNIGVDLLGGVPRRRTFTLLPGESVRADTSGIYEDDFGCPFDCDDDISEMPAQFYSFDALDVQPPLYTYDHRSGGSICLTTTLDATVLANDWTERVITGNAVGASSVFAVDVDGDGDLDVLSASAADDTIAWYENEDGAGTFGDVQVITSLADGASSVFAADVDGDGDLDVFSASAADDTIAWYENTDGAGTFGAAPIVITSGALGASSVFAADMDGDLDLDVLSASADDDTIAWYQNTDAAGTFAAPPTSVIATGAAGASSVFAADLDGDLDLDVLSASAADHTVAWYENTDGAGAFAAPATSVIASDALAASSVFAADLDRDGDMDVLSASADDHTIAWYENDPDDTGALGSFGPRQEINADAAGASSVFAADMDGDGDMDVLSASALDAQIAWYENLGAGSFGAVQVLTALADGASSVFAADVDGDGDIDALAASAADDTVAWHEIASFVSFATHPLAASAPGAAAFDAVDVDRDGDPDLLATLPVELPGEQREDQLVWYENDGTPADDTWSPREIALLPGGISAVRGADVDRDGDFDVVAANLAGDEVVWFEQLDPQQALWSDAVTIANPVGPADLDVADADGDGDLDVLTASREAGGRIGWYENDGAPMNRDWSVHNAAVAAGDPTAVLAVDVDLDGDLDTLWTSNAGAGIGWQENRSIHRSANFLPSGERVITSEALGATSVFAADVDGDGDVDVLSTSASDATVAWSENTDGAGSFGPRQVISTDSPTPYWGYAADLDGDGDVDVLSASLSDDTIAWYENTDGAGSFGPQQVITAAADGAVRVSAADVDGDGDADVLSASVEDATIAWYENTDGAGSFGPARAVTLDANQPLSLAAADLDDDGDLDLLSAAFGDGRVVWYENTDGAGSFGPPRVIAIAAPGAYSVTAADVDRDGDLDVLAASFLDDTVAWYENTDGAGSFGAQEVITTSADGATSVIAADVDGDGDLDVLTTSAEDGTVAWYENADGAGSFGAQQAITTGAPGAIAVVAADVDRDGDVDALSASLDDSTIAWYENRSSHFSLTTSDIAPAQAFAGSPVGLFAIDVTHEGRAGDTDLELSRMVVSLDDGAGSALSDAQADALIEGFALYLEDGSGLLEVDVDAEVGDFGSPSLDAQGRATLEVPFGDRRLALAPRESRRFLLGARLQADVAGASPSVFRVIHTPEQGSAARPVGGNVALLLREPAPDVASTAVSVDEAVDSDLDGLSDQREAVIGTLPGEADSDGDGLTDGEEILSYGTDPLAWDSDGDGLSDGEEVLSADPSEVNDGKRVAFERQVAEPGELSDATALVTTDLDGDGDLDVAVADAVSDSVVWYANVIDPVGASTLVGPALIASPIPGASDLAVADIDRDGHTDLLVASAGDDGVRWLANEGGVPLVFSSYVVATGVAEASAVQSGDFDADGDPDVVSASFEDGTVAWHENDGSPRDAGGAWTTHLVGQVSGPRALSVVDVDRDGDADVAVASRFDDEITIFVNEGGGQLWTPAPLSPGFDGPEEVLAADLDGDGDPDLAAASVFDDRVAWYSNDGSGGFGSSSRTTSVADGARSISAADVDADGDVDLLSASSNDGNVAWYENRAGDGSEWPRHLLLGGPDPRSPGDVVAADVDADGDLDVLSGAEGAEALVVHENLTLHRSASFPELAQIAAANVADLRSADVDRDGDLDVLAAANGGVTWYANDGSSAPALWTVHELVATASRPSVLALGDPDGDADLDVLVSADGALAWYENDGSPAADAWSVLGVPVVVGDVSSVVVADLDGDGDADVVSAAADGDQISWYENGAGWLDRSIAPSLDAEVFGAADIDGDGDPDLLAGGPAGTLWLENNDGGTSWSERPIALLYTDAVAGADLDGDGDIDVASISGGGIVIHWNVLKDLPAFEFFSRSVAGSVPAARTISAADLDRDGDLDLAVGVELVVGGGEPPKTIAWYENPGGAFPELVEHLLEASENVGPPAQVLAADLDGNASPDLLFGNSQQVAWLSNRGGHYALITPDDPDRTLTLQPGESTGVLALEARHLGRSSDAEVELVSMALRFEDAVGTPVASASDSIAVYRDDGTGELDGNDALVQSVSTVDLATGVQTIGFAVGDSDVRVMQGTPETYFAQITLAVPAAGLVHVVHLPERSAARDADHGIALESEGATPVPEPGGLALLLTGLLMHAGLLAWRERRKARAGGTR